MIRRAEIRDIERIHELLRQVNLVHYLGRPDLFRLGSKYTDEELKEIIQDDNRPIFVYTDEEDKVLGYAFCIHQQILSSNLMTDIRTLYIDDLCVDEADRGMHIGTKLYEYVLKYAKEHDYYNVTLNVWAFNEKALAFYEHLGLQKQKIYMETIL